MDHVIWFSVPFLTPGSLHSSECEEGKQILASPVDLLVGGRWKADYSEAYGFQFLNDWCNIFLAITGDIFSSNSA